jgi:hypothetical protein
METYNKVIAKDDTLVFSTAGDLFRFLNNASGSAAKK